MNITPISQTNFKSRYSEMTPEERKDMKENAALGAGGAVGVAATVKKGEQTLQGMMNGVKRTATAVNQSSKTFTGLFKTFKSNVEIFSAHIKSGLLKFADRAYLGPIVKSPITQKVAGLAGGILSFFVLATGINKAVKNGNIAVSDMNDQYDRYRNVA